MITSVVGAYTAQVSAGVITLSYGRSSVLVGRGSAVQLVESANLHVYWLDSSNALQRAIVGSPLALSSIETVASNVTAFFVRDVTSRGIAFAYVIGTTIYFNILGSVVTSEWPAVRLPDFSFDLSADLQLISILYRRPGSPIQAFVEQLEAGSEPVPAATPVILPAAGSYSGSVTVTITCETHNSTIYYTIDGSEPTSSSAIYTSSFELTTSATVKAMALAVGYTQSATATTAYVITRPITRYAEVLRIYDFELGPRNLPDILALN
jgi:hypothetical protein